MSAVAAIAGGTVFFGKTYGEAVGLVVEARDYLEAHRIEGETEEPATRLVYCVETLRLTTRLTRIMAWLLAQRAAHSGEISAEEALAEPLEALGICVDGAEQEERVPPRLTDLLGRSRRLYTRVARLDALARREVTSA